MGISMNNPTGQNTECREVIIGPHRLTFSYNTLIGYNGVGYNGVRLRNYWGPTTGRHIHEALQYADEVDCSPEEFEAIVEYAINNGFKDFHEAYADKLMKQRKKK